MQPTFEKAVMGRILHGTVTDMRIIRAEIQNAETDFSQLTARLNIKTFQKWESRSAIETYQPGNLHIDTTLTKYMWIKGMVEVIRKKIKSAAVRHLRCKTTAIFKKHHYEYSLIYNFNFKLRGINRVAPFEIMQQWYQKQPRTFSVNPNHFYSEIKQPARHE